ncbi:MAG: DUF6567 family protein [Bacteroidota bacterium]
MKNTVKVIMSLALIVGLGSCGVNRAWVFNQNQSTTEVHLGGNNFRVVDQVKGTAEVSYVLIFGGAKKKALYDEAYAAMIDNAEMKVGSRALTNVLTEEHVGGVPPFFYTRTVTVRANLIEFTN